MDNYIYKELSHSGIKGMKWGVRRYQNADGSLTDAGKKRYKDVHEDYAKAHIKKSVKQMSDKELRERNNRLEMERKYAQFSKKESRGKKAVKTFIGVAGTIVAIEGAAKTYERVGKALLDKIGKMKV